MFKLMTLLFCIIATNLNVFASEGALTALAKRGLTEGELVSLVEKYPELKNLEISFAEKENNSDSLTIRIFAEEVNEAYTIVKTKSGIDIEKTDAQYDVELENIEGKIKNTLFETILFRTDSEKLATILSEVFKDDFTTTKGLKVKSSYSFEVIKYFKDGQFIKYGDILKSSITIGRALSSKTFQMNTDKKWCLLPEEMEVADKPFYAPVRSSRISSLFQLNRRHPVKKRHQPHNGVDFVAKSGTLIYPAMAGEVITISRSRSKGKFITIRHENGYETSYMHLKGFSKRLHIGKQVDLEDDIGEVGRTGFATGAHLHFGVTKNGFYINPIHLLKSYSYDQKDQHDNIDGEDAVSEVNEDVVFSDIQL